MDELTKRNFHALSDGLKDCRSQIDALKEDGKRKDAIIAQQNLRIDSMQQRVNVLYVKTIGSGATT